MDDAPLRYHLIDNDDFELELLINLPPLYLVSPLYISLFLL